VTVRCALHVLIFGPYEPCCRAISVRPVHSCVARGCESRTIRPSPGGGAHLSPFLVINRKRSSTSARFSPRSNENCGRRVRYGRGPPAADDSVKARSRALSHATAGCRVTKTAGTQREPHPTPLGGGTTRGWQWAQGWHLGSWLAPAVVVIKIGAGGAGGGRLGVPKTPLRACG
jgi:hypothetical protein